VFYSLFLNPLIVLLRSMSILLVNSFFTQVNVLGYAFFFNTCTCTNTVNENSQLSIIIYFLHFVIQQPHLIFSFNYVFVSVTISHFCRFLTMMILIAAYKNYVTYVFTSDLIWVIHVLLNGWIFSW